MLKIKNQGIISVKKIFSDLIIIENEYSRLFRSDLKKMMSEIQGNKLVSWTIMNLTRNLADNIKIWNYTSFLKWG